MNFIENIINNFANILFSTVGGSIETIGSVAPTTTTASATNTTSAGIDIMDDSSSLGLGVVTLGSAVSSAAFQTDDIIDQTKMNVSTQYVESLNDNELNDLASKLESIINEDKPIVLAKTYNPNKRV